MKLRLTSFFILLATLGLIASGCNGTSAATSKPIVAISSPPSNSQFHEGEQVAIQSTSIDPAGVARVELLVDGVVVRDDSTPQSQVSYTLIQMWSAIPGLHTLTVRSVNQANETSEPAAISVLVLSNLAKTPTVIPLATATAAPRACLNAAFVADVTVPDGTIFSPGQSFNKIWRMRNTGSCAWGPDEQFAFVDGAALTPNAAIAVPTTPAGGTADLLIAMTAPTTPGSYSSQWRLKDRANGSFGATFNVTINVSGPTAASCPFSPIIESFTVSSSTINPGQSATLSWGFVKGAQIAEIDNDIGGIATPGSISIAPPSTTTYTLTATCGSKVTKAQVSINVVSASPSATLAAAPSVTATRTPNH